MTIKNGSYLTRQASLNIEDAVNSTPSFFSVKKFREKRWSYIGVISDECISGTALVHLGYACNAFSFVYDRKEKKLIEKGYVLSPFSGMQFDRNPDNGDCRMQNKGDSIDMLHRCNEGKRLLTINIAKDTPQQILANITIEEDLQSKPLQLLTPMQNGKKVFTQKNAGLRAEGSIQTKDKKFTFNKDNSFVIFDWTNGFHNRITEWNWASAGGISNCGKRIGINFSSGVYTSGYEENVIWIDGEPELQEKIIFNYNAQQSLDPWTITNTDKTIHLTFIPEQMRCSKDNFGIIASSFMQPCGSYSGFITSKAGERIEINNMGGVVEEHYARW
jgi:hypothetical protein